MSAQRQRLIEALKQVLPSANLLWQKEDTAPYECDGLAAYRTLPIAVALPENEAQVQAVLKACNAFGVPVVPRGAGTGLSGGAMPMAEGIVLSTAKLNKILDVDPLSRRAVLQPGVRNLAISEAAAPYDLYYAPDPSSQIACSIGGNVAENSGGVHCLKYGLTVNNVIKVRAVLMDGETVEFGTEALDAPGLDLLGVMIGSEGMLAVMTEVVVRLIPKPPAARVIMASFDDMTKAGNAVADVIAAGLIPAGLEMMDKPATRAVEEFVHAGYDLNAEAILLCESDGTPEEVEEEIERMSAVSIINKCVHCGFCTATCPTYQVLGDELDGPRGRIYLMKEMVEGAPVTAKTQMHLDRCLTCRNCETTCPSGVRYGRLVDIGRRYVDERVMRPLSERIQRWLMRETLSRRNVFAFLFGIARFMRPVLPASLKKKVQVPQPAGVWPTIHASRQMLLHEGCVQPTMMPNVDAATARVFAKLGIELVTASSAECCGAIRQHLNDHHGAEAQMKRNIDAWWPYVERGVDTIVINASGCGVMIKDYAEILAHDPVYAEKAACISAMAKDVSEILPDFGSEIDQLANAKRAGGLPERVTYHPPCTMQHGMKIRGHVEALLGKLGVSVKLCQDSHLCCGSAGTYSILQPTLSQELRDRKLTNILKTDPQEIVSGNVGCINHLQSGTGVPVRHWIELVDRMI